jgi:hypothetical protein
VGAGAWQMAFASTGPIARSAPRKNGEKFRLHATALVQLAAQPLFWCLLATACLVLALPGTGWDALTNWLGDTDDAVRLVSVRELLDGAPWFDTTLARIGAPEPLISHWSRLIDLPLAALMTIFRPLLGSHGAEIATRWLWPVLLFLALMLIYTREALRRAGPWAAAFAAVLVVMCAIPMIQFKPGRIDHHNAQILCAVAGLLFLVRSLETARLGWIAGAFLGLGLAVGYEAIGLVVPALGLTAIVTLWRGRGMEGAAHAATAAAGTMFVALLVTTPPARWLAIHCDALSLNLPLLAGCCAAGLWGARRLPMHASPFARLSVAAVGVAMGGGLYAGLEPACLLGPFGQVNPALKTIWLDSVMESRNILALGDGRVSPGLAFAAFVALGAGAQLAGWLRQRDVTNGLAAAIIVLAGLLGCWQIKLMIYACWLAIMPVAVLAARLERVGTLSAPIVRIAVVIVLNQAMFDTALSAGETAVRALAGVPAAEAVGPDVGADCAKTTNVSRLAVLPPGLVVSNIDLGPHIVATTSHRVVAAPYHRLDKGILAAHAILNARADDGAKELAALGVDYVVLCAETGKAVLDPGAGGVSESLRARLRRGESVSYLQEIPLPAGTPIKAWRVLSPPLAGPLPGKSAGKVAGQLAQGITAH